MHWEPPADCFEASALYPGLNGWGSRAHMTSGDAGGTLNAFPGYGNVESFYLPFFCANPLPYAVNVVRFTYA